jgi:hypothetical protein
VKNTELKEARIVAWHCGPVSVTKWSDEKWLWFPLVTVMTLRLLQLEWRKQSNLFQCSIKISRW